MMMYNRYQVVKRSNMLRKKISIERMTNRMNLLINTMEIVSHCL
jgi:hypothetical protein